MNRINFKRATDVLFGTARRSIVRVTLGLGAIYAAFCCYYLLWPEAPGSSTLALITAVSAVGLISAAAWGWRRLPSVIGTHCWLICFSAVVLFNVNAALVASNDYLFAVSHLFVQLAAAVLAPTILFFSTFLVVNFASCLLTFHFSGIETEWDLGALGFLMTTAVSILMFVFRLRNVSIMEGLRQEVEESRDRDFQELIEKNPYAVVLVRDGVIAYASKPLAEYLLLDSANEVVGKSLDSLVVEGASDLNDLLCGDSPEPSCVVTLARRDGDHVLVDISEPKTISFGESEAQMLVARDVTASQEALTARLLLADRMSAAGTLAAGVAHEINNPLTYVTFNLSALEEELDAGSGSECRANVAELVSEIRDGVERVTAIVGDLGVVSSIGEADDSRVDASQALRTAIKLVSNQLRHRTELLCELDRLPKVIANDGKLVQVFTNILINAAHAIDSRGSIDGTLCVETRCENAEAIIEITDSGCGMTEETQKRLFEPFYTTKPPGSGTGLGLFFCHTVITKAGGRIEVESELDVGSCVRVVLPIANNPTGRFQAPIRSRQRRPIEDAPLRVLVVDDEPFVGKAISRVLANYDVTVASCGEDAIAKFGRFKHDLVLCDIMMPGLSGPQVYERLLKLDPTAEDRIVFMTGGAFTPHARAFANARADTILKKPVAVATLLELAESTARKKAEL